MNSSNATPGVTPAAQPLDVKKLIGRYVQLRDRKRELEEQHKATLDPFIKLMSEIEGVLLSHMQQSGADSIATADGTAYQKTSPRATIRDAAAFRQWVISNNAFDMVDWRANANAVFDHISANKGVPPPGVNASTFTSVGFRRPTE